MARWVLRPLCADERQARASRLHSSRRALWRPVRSRTAGHRGHADTAPRRCGRELRRRGRAFRFLADRDPGLPERRGIAAVDHRVARAIGQDPAAAAEAIALLQSAGLARRGSAGRWHGRRKGRRHLHVRLATRPDGAAHLQRRHQCRSRVGARWETHRLPWRHHHDPGPLVGPCGRGRGARAAPRDQGRRPRTQLVLARRAAFDLQPSPRDGGGRSVDRLAGLARCRSSEAGNPAAVSRIARQRNTTRVLSRWALGGVHLG